jgi:hypothetical protein
LLRTIADFRWLRDKLLMSFSRRDTLGLLSVTIAGAAIWGRADSAAASTVGALSVETKQLAPFELQGKQASLASLADDVAEYSVQRMGKSVSAVWLRGRDGQVWFVTVDSRDALPRFEVFTLGIDTLDELQTRWREWKAPQLPDDMPEGLRALMMTRPAMPTPPPTFDAWPFTSWRTQVLRRAEFIIEDVSDVPTFGENPNMQSATRPMAVPSEASASCVVAVGFLFTGANGKRLLMGVDWMPLNMVVTDVAAEIDEYLAPCEAVDLDVYLDRRAAGY